MLHLLPSVLFSKITNRQFFLQKIFLLVFLGHLLLFGAIVLFSMIKKDDKFTILMHQAGATYVLMPLQKKINFTNRSGQYRNSSSLKKSQVLNYEDYLQKKRLHRGKKYSKRQQKEIAAAKEKSQISKMKLKSKSKSSAIIASFEKQVANKKNKKKKKDNVKLISEQQEHPEKQKESLNQDPQQDQQMDKQIIQENSIEPKQDQAAEDNQAVQIDETSLDEVIFVGYEQFDECIIGSKIQQAVVQSWMPPVGIEAGVSCEMKVKVSAQGIADTVEIVKSSGILLYDTSARTALYEIEFPKEVYGKTIRIVLGN